VTDARAAALRGAFGARRTTHLLLGCVVLMCVWEIVGRYGMLGKTFPALSRVLHVFAEYPRRALLLRAVGATLGSASAGYGAGLCLGIGAAILAHLVPPLRGGLDRLAVLVNALPVIALAPVLIITAGRQATPATLASIPVFFLMYTSATVGLHSASRRLDMVLSSLGANRWQRLTHLEAIAALPSIFSGMKISAGSAMIGAIVGEWFGAPSGLGVVVLNSMQNFQVPLLWATVIVIATITLGVYGVLTLGERFARRRFGECAG
jgi:ABC-type nitrate/sulfonate/bicarbonate transport system permease component